MSEVEELLDLLGDIKPVVDNPAGLMHNYMARKPYNVVGQIIDCLARDELSVVYDPMAGSGTVVIEAAKRGKIAIGVDVNPIAELIARVSLTEWDVGLVRDAILSFLNRLAPLNEELYGITVGNESGLIERCHFCWDDERLRPEEFWFKPRKANGKYAARRKVVADEAFVSAYESFAGYAPHNIENFRLIPNTRIAIPDGRTSFDYFCSRNLRFLDEAIGVLREFDGVYGFEALELLISSSINLIKISDKKASSQIPFWIPKKNVTSRNAFLVMEKKAKAVLEGLAFCQGEVQSHYSAGAFNPHNKASYFYCCPAQSVPISQLPDCAVDLVITDPPYTDQVPYMEYSQLASGLMGYEIDSSLEGELVVTDAPSRKKGVEEFRETFREIIRRTNRSMKPGAYFAMFYHSFDLSSWDDIITLMAEEGFRYCNQIPIAAPRKSFKTVMSPGRTLNGNYLVLFVKDEKAVVNRFEGTVKEAEELARRKAAEILARHETHTLQTVYDEGLLKDAVEVGYLSVLAKSHKTFQEFLPLVD